MGVIATIFLLIVIATLGTDGLAYIILAGLALCFMVGMIQGMVERSRNKSNRKEIIVKPNVNTDTNNRLDSCSKINHRCTMSANIPNCTLDLYQNAADKEAKRKQYASLVRVAGMSGSQFEKFCAELLECNGFHDVQLVCSKMYAEGVDITAKRDQARYAFQCIRTNKREIGKKEIMEVHKSKSYYSCDCSVIITNSFFAKEAIELANTTHTILWDDRDLQRLMDRAAKIKYPSFHSISNTDSSESAFFVCLKQQAMLCRQKKNRSAKAERYGKRAYFFAMSLAQCWHLTASSCTGCLQ